MTGQQLKNSILQEAIQGRLVPNVLQPGEKTGAELLQDILAERQKKAPKLTLSTIEEEPWELPEGWCWCKLGDLCDRLVGKTPERANAAYWSPEKMPWVSISDMKDYGTVFSTKESVSALAESNVFSNRVSKKGSLIMSFKLTVGRTCLLGIDAYHNEAIATFLIPDWLESLKMYLFWLLPVFTNASDSKDAVKGKTLNKDSINATDIPLPPISIQKAIVAKIEALFPLVDEYDKAAGELKALNESLPDKLRKSVLQEAIHGTLVPNDIPDGEATAQELLQQILKERQDKENKEKGKKAKKLTLSTIEEELWELPEGWCWCQVSDIGDIITGSTPSKEHPEYYGQDVPFYKPSDLDQGISVVKAHDYLSTKGFTFARQLPELSILVTCIGATIGKVGLIRKAGSCNQQINAIIPERPICSQFLFYCIGSPYFQNEIKSNASATTLPILNKNGFASLSIPLPPLSIQHRIVEKIEQLFSEIEKL